MVVGNKPCKFRTISPLSISTKATAPSGPSDVVALLSVAFLFLERLSYSESAPASSCAVEGSTLSCRAKVETSLTIPLLKIRDSSTALGMTRGCPPDMNLHGGGGSAALCQTLQLCQGQDSNLHAFRHQILSLARLPIPPPWPFDYQLLINRAWLPFSFVLEFVLEQ